MVKLTAPVKSASLAESRGNFILGDQYNPVSCYVPASASEAMLCEGVL